MIIFFMMNLMFELEMMVGYFLEWEFVGKE